MIFKTYLNLVAFALLAASHLPALVFANETGCVSTFDAKKDYFPDKVESKYGSGFEIIYKGNAKYIHNKIAGENYVLYQCGTPAPTDVNPTPADSLQVGNWTKMAAVPGSKIVLDSAPTSAILEMLGLQNTVAASYKFFEVTSPCMQQLLSGLPRIAHKFNKRRLTRRVAYDIGNTDLQWTFTTYGMNDAHSFSVNPESATDMLGKAEWIKFVAAFFNKEAEANKIFAEIEDRYNAAKHGSTTSATKKTVGFARYNKVANGTIIGWTIDQPQAWMAQGLADAGLDVHNHDTAAFTDIDSFNKATSKWNVLIDLSMEPLTHGGAKVPEWDNLVSGYKVDDTHAKSSGSEALYLSDKSIYRSDLISSYRNATDYNEHLQIQVDVLLQDLRKLATADSGATDTKWYRNLPNQVGINWVSAANCKN
ncbi:hypothetical protein H4S08_001019 [Coemansia sp. RSA 1365]|nr:hypothetical protein H4S08_001019 [Coemansia sp. RSA 1365]